MRRLVPPTLLFPLALLGGGCFAPGETLLIEAEGTSGGQASSGETPTDDAGPGQSGPDGNSTGADDATTGPIDTTDGTGAGPDDASSTGGDDTTGEPDDGSSGSSGDGPTDDGSSSTSGDEPVNVIDADVYVDADEGNDKGDGSLADPVATITAALEMADNGDVIAVFPGTYDEEGGEEFPLQIPSGVSLIGDPQDRGAGANPTVISGSGLIEGDFHAAIEPGVNTEIRGFTIVGGTTLLHFGVFVETNAVLAENTYDASYGGIRLAGGSPMIEQSTFETNSYGVYGCFGTGTIDDNHFVSPALNVDLQGVGPCTVSNNLIEGTGQVGIQNQGGSHVISGNTFDMPNGYTYGCLSTSGTSVVRDNHCDVDQGAAIRVISSGSPNLGTPDEPGNNMLGHINAIGVQHEGTSAITARGNAWATPSPSCGAQIVVEGTGNVWWGNGPQDVCE